MKRRAFTLLELLVSVALIAVLTVLGLSVNSAMRSRSNLVRCAQNLKQLGTYFNIFAQDNNGFYPYVARYKPGGVNQHWYYNPQMLEIMHVSLDDVWKGRVPFFLCPEDPDGMKETFGGIRVLSYGVNIAIGSGGSSGYTGSKYIQTRFTAIENPSKLMLACDAREYYLQVKSGAVPNAAYRHREGANALFCDGHVAWMKGPLPKSTQNPGLWWPDGVAR